LGSGGGKRRRNSYDIWASILDLLIEEEKTLNGVRDATRLNQERLKHHLDDMVSLGLVRSDRSRRFTTYSITEHGIRWREGYKGIATGSFGKEDHQADF
jgi:predicted transcriptional regulator